MVGNVPVGGNAPISVQTMTNTLTSDAKATIDQIRRCEDAGADIIRVSCPDVESTAALKEIVRAARVPIVADIHFHYKRALEAADPARVRTPIALLSANAMEQHRLQGAEAGADLHISKPITPESLIAGVQQALRAGAAARFAPPIA